MKKLLFLTLSVSLLTFYSCKEDLQPEGTNQPSSFTDLFVSRDTDVTEADGNISVVAIDHMFGEPSASLNSFTISGYFKGSNGQLAPISNFTAGNLTIPNLTNNKYSLHKNNITTTDNISQAALDFLGQSINFSVNGTAFGSNSTSLHMPALPNTVIHSTNNVSLKKVQPLKIDWQPDPYAGDGEGDDRFGIAIIYHASTFSNSDQSGLPTQNISIFKHTKDLDGTITITPSDLSVFPLKGYVTVYAGRAHQKRILTSTGKSLNITNLTVSMSQDLQVQ